MLLYATMILILVSLVVLESVMGSERDLTRALLENYVASARPVNNVGRNILPGPSKRTIYTSARPVNNVGRNILPGIS